MLEASQERASHGQTLRNDGTWTEASAKFITVVPGPLAARFAAGAAQ